MRALTSLTVTILLCFVVVGCAVGGTGTENNNNVHLIPDAFVPRGDGQTSPDTAVPPDASVAPDGGCQAGYTGPDCDECDTGYLVCGNLCVSDCQSCPGKPALCQDTSECLADCTTCSGTCDECGENEHSCSGGCHPDAADIPSTGCRLTCDDQPCAEPAHATASCTAGLCDFTCDAAGHFVESGGACICDTAGHWVDSGGTCVCDSAAHYVDSGGACVCDAAGHWVDSGGTCVCDTGYVEQGGQCVPDTGCPGTVNGSYCYWYVATAAAWDAAEADCVSGGGHLVSIVDSTENTFVQGLASADFWIGLRDYATGSQSGSGSDDCTDNFLIAAGGGHYTGSSSYDDTDACNSFWGEDNIFYFSPTAAQVYVFATAGSTYDTVLGLYTKASGSGYTGCIGTELACDDDDGPGVDSLIIEYLNAGDYVIMLDAYDDLEYGTYHLQVRKFEFVDGTAHGWANWNSEEPNGDGAEYCAMMYQTTGYWNDAECSVARPYVCKK